MNPSFSHPRHPRTNTVLSAIAFLPALCFMVGCGGNASSTTKAPPGNTMVTVMATSTANDQLSHFDLDFNSIILTSKSGETVNLLPAIEHAEFIHLNGNSEPLFTVSVPKDTYTSAVATIGSEVISCFGVDPDYMTQANIYSYGYTPDSHVTVNLPTPIVIGGSSMVLSLDMLVSQSASWSPATCVTNVPNTFLLTPTFDLMPAQSSQSKMRGLDGTIVSVDDAGNSFTVTAVDGPDQELDLNGVSVNSNAPSWQVNTTGSTAFQGIPALSALTVGTPVDMDASLQADGSLVATRIAVYDTAITNLSVSSGPLLKLLSSEPDLIQVVSDATDNVFTDGGDAHGNSGPDLNYENAVFQISGEFSNLRQLPFPASFNAAIMADGQSLFVTTHATSIPYAPYSISATTITLMPQTINGTVTAIATEGGFDTYTITLAAYDLFPQLAVQVYQNTVLSNPSTVVIYADSNTQMLNSEPIAVGAMARFNGLIFNDNGTLRMDCAQINDGVAE